MHIFRRRRHHPDADERIDAHMMKIWALLDGRKNLASIAFASGMTMSEFQRAVKALIDLDLIVPVEAEDIPTN